MDELKSAMNECIPLLQKFADKALKERASDLIKSLTERPEGVELILSNTELFEALLELTTDDSPQVAKNAISCFINIMAFENMSTKVFEVIKAQPEPFPLVAVAIKETLNENCPNTDNWLMLLSNATRAESVAHEVAETLLKDEESLSALVSDAFCNMHYNKTKCHLDYLGQLIGNLSQTHEMRELLCRKRYDLLEKLLPFTTYNFSEIRRHGMINMLKNICLDDAYLDVIINEKDDILVALLLPICGPEEFSDEENEKFPLQLQYLPDNKQREKDATIRLTVLEALLQLCATKRGREWLRAKGVYEILREYHKWETNANCLLACENVVDILIKKEEEIGLDNYKEVEVPADVVERFEKES